MNRNSTTLLESVVDVQQKEANMLILCDQSKQAYTEVQMQDKMQKIKSLQPFYDEAQGER